MCAGESRASGVRGRENRLGVVPGCLRHGDRPWRTDERLSVAGRH